MSAEEATTTQSSVLGPSGVGGIFGAYAAEAFGTFLFVWMGTGTILATQQISKGGPLDDTAISVAFGLGLMVAVFATAGVSGAHLNPAVTVGLAVVRKFPWREVPGYVIAQFVGAILAGLVNWALFGGGKPRSDLLLGATQPGTRGDWIAVIAEAILTFVLMMTIMATAVDRRSPGSAAAGLAIGFVVGAGIFATLPVSGGSFNPARTLGPMIAAGQFNAWWVYILGPLVGAIVGALCWEFVISRAVKPSV